MEIKGAYDLSVNERELVRDDSVRPDESRSTFTSTAGGVMTVEAGAITGELELSTYRARGALEVLVRYSGAEEWYVVEGSPVPLQTHLDTARILRHLTNPGKTMDGNEEAISLTSLSARID